MPFYEKGDVGIRYEEAGSGFPLLLVPGGGLNSRISNWRTAVFNSMEIFKYEFRCITIHGVSVARAARTESSNDREGQTLSSGTSTRGLATEG